ADEKRPEAQADGDRQFFLDELPDLLVLEKAFAEVKARKLDQHFPKAFVGRLVKAVKRLDLFNALGIHALRAAVAQAAAFRTGAAAGLGLGKVLLDRTTRHKLDHAKGNEQHAEQRGNHQQQAFEDVSQHVYLAHQVSMAQDSPWEYGGVTAGRARRLSLNTMRCVPAVHCGTR